MRRRQSESEGGRKVRAIPAPVRIFTITEGRKTEPIYFEKFRGTRFFPRIITARSPKAMIEVASDIIENENIDSDQGDKIWFVFDKDELEPEIIKETFEWAIENRVGLAFSNPCFELWFLLHFNYTDTSYSCKDTIKKLKDAMRKSCKKQFSKNTDCYNELLRFREIAIKNSKKLHKIRIEDGIEGIPFHSSVTFVYQLVESLILAADTKNTPSCKIKKE